MKTCAWWLRTGWSIPFVLSSVTSLALWKLSSASCILRGYSHREGTCTLWEKKRVHEPPLCCYVCHNSEDGETICQNDFQQGNVWLYKLPLIHLVTESVPGYRVAPSLQGCTTDGAWQEGRRLWQAVFKAFVPGRGAAALTANRNVTDVGLGSSPGTAGTGRQRSAFFRAMQEGYASPTPFPLALFAAFVLANSKCKIGRPAVRIWSLPGPSLDALCTQGNPCLVAADSWYLRDLAYLGSAGFSWRVVPCALGLRDAPVQLLLVSWWPRCRDAFKTSVCDLVANAHWKYPWGNE